MIFYCGNVPFSDCFLTFKIYPRSSILNTHPALVVLTYITLNLFSTKFKWRE